MKSTLYEIVERIMTSTFVKGYVCIVLVVWSFFKLVKFIKNEQFFTWKEKQYNQYKGFYDAFMNQQMGECKNSEKTENNEDDKNCETDINKQYRAYIDGFQEGLTWKHKYNEEKNESIINVNHSIEVK